MVYLASRPSANDVPHVYVFVGDSRTLDLGVGITEDTSLVLEIMKDGEVRLLRSP